MLGDACMPQTLFDKLWNQHVVSENEDTNPLLYIDLHLLHEVLSPQAFEGLRMNGFKVRRPDLTFATTDHNVPTTERTLPLKDKLSNKQVLKLIENCKEFGIQVYDLNHEQNGIVHIIGPELGLTTPGKTVVCCDSHTSTHGAFGAFAFGIGTSESEHVLATQTLYQAKPKTMQVNIEGQLRTGVTAKDVILALVGKIGTSGGSGYSIEFTGSTIRNMSMEERMTVCNMVIEAGAKTGVIAPDQKTFDYIKGRTFAPKGKLWDEALSDWKKLVSDPGAEYDVTLDMDVSDLAPQVTWGTNPGMVVSVNESVPDPLSYPQLNQRNAVQKALDYMGLEPGTRMEDIQIDIVFIGSCTNSRIEDLRLAAKAIQWYGKKVASQVQAIIVPGSYQVKRQAELEKLDHIFMEAGFEWREPGCSMCLGMNPDQLKPKERCASTSNRNFEGRQGKDGRTHLVSPVMAAAAAMEGHFVDVSKWNLDSGRL